MTRESVNPIGAPSYVEIGVPDPEMAISFYTALLDWNVTAMPGGGQADTGGLGIGFHSGDLSAIHEVFYLVTDLEASIAKLRSLGGTTIGEIQDSGDFGRWTECATTRVPVSASGRSRDNARPAGMPVVARDRRPGAHTFPGYGVWLHRGRRLRRG